MSKYQKFIIKEKQKYIKHSETTENNVRRFKKKLCCLNSKTGEFFKIKHEPQKVQKDNYLWFMFNTMLQVERSKESDEIGIFLTCSLPTEFHPFTKWKNGKELKEPINNYLYDKTLTINDGYNKFNDFFRDLYKNFKVGRKHVKIKFSKVIEYHHDFTPHLHAGIYVKAEHLEKFIEYIKKQIEAHTLGAEYKIEIIRDVMKLSGYISKYMRKTMNSDNEQDFHLLNGWKKINKIRNFTHSNIKLFRYIYKKVNTITELSKKLEKTNPITHLLANCEINVKTFDNKTNNLVKEEHWKQKEEQRFNVEVERTRTIKKKALLDTATNEIIKFKKVYTYKITKFIVKEKERTWYDKADYVYFHNMTEDEYLNKDEKIEQEPNPYEFNNFFNVKNFDRKRLDELLISDN